MFNAIIEFFKSLPAELYVFIISILPLVELRGAVPVGAVLELPFYINYILSVVGNLLPIPFILLFIPKILNFLARFKLFRPMVGWLRKKADKHSGKVLKEEAAASASHLSFNPAENEKENGEKTIVTPDDTSDTPESAPTVKRRMSRAIFIGLLLFVALPVPGTGAWTGALVAALFGLPKRWSMLSISLGVMLCGVVMCLASYGVLGFLSFLL